ncbi:cysteine-rich CWC family protein [Halalkalibacterium halodurans]|nr:cysteine-rich CWC family protein [Halalkalibacterium halodurans]MED4081162.1 cysteine-rich CWC family protein [Halalkalibacterium halodurans]MED4084405.1 cysteine-rich CWC family protein [Halalkalibacterium halodurans]MED4103526.1 cysteine-rich CWC family protein [Halalkalibacterium halodurans]MED4108791.1 cysteine-rich CWC family protein [Halalkalibacterium halodurans]MED4126213.1 cysteine-rich CWC family protein [Halalkalibacterium halodurans]
MPKSEQNKHCPICGKGNNCGYGDCWCNDEVFPNGIFLLVPPEHVGKSCICRECVIQFRKSKNKE